jgi:hypothetical protein
MRKIKSYFFISLDGVVESPSTCSCTRSRSARASRGCFRLTSPLSLSSS